jgi:gliding motility-associated-like protein
MLMKRFFTLVAATAIAVLSLISSKSYGSHAVGADVTYQYVGPNQYLVTVRFYRDCDGISAPTSVNLSYASSCFPSGNVTLTQAPGSGLEIPPSPCLPPVTTTCNGGSGYGVQEYIYQGLVTLGGPCADWTFSFTECCRNASITTLTNPASFNLFVASTLDNFNAPTNSSPVFSNIPVTQFCVGNEFYYNQSATDVDGDSLVFSLAPALTAAGTPVTYAPPNTALSPLASSTPVVIDPQTGTISFTPSTIQVGVIAVICEEFRNGIKIGEVRRDIQMNVVGGCVGTAPVFADPVDPQGNPAPFYTASCGDTSVWIILDQPVQCGSVTETDIRILTPQGTLNPVLNALPFNCVNGQTDSILVSFFYPLSAGTTLAFTKVGFDNNTFLSECGVQMPEFDSIQFNVIDPGIFNTETFDVGCSFDNVTVTFDYEISCNTVTSSGSEFFFVDANGVVYPVTAVTNCPGGNGYSSTVTFNLASNISPATPVHLIVQSGSDANTFTNRCNTFIDAGDTLAVLNVLNNLIVDLGVDPVICDTDPFPVLDAGISGATYTWTLNGNTLPDQTQTITASGAGTYIVNVSVTPVCQGSDTLQFTVNTTPVVALGNDISLCDTDPVPVFDAGNPGATYQWYNGSTAIPGETTQFFQPLVAGTYSVLVNNGGSCVGGDTVVVTILAQLQVNLPVDATICSTDPLPVLDAGVPNGTYVWFLNGTQLGLNTQTITTVGAGIYTVEVTSLSGCTGTDTYELTVVQAPVVSLGADTTICASDVLILDAGNSGATYQWSLNGTPISGATNQTYQPTQTGNYSVLVNTGGQCQAGGDIDVTVVQQLTVNVADAAICSDQAFPTLDAGVSGVNYTWTLNGNVVGTSQTYQPTQAGQYTITINIGACNATDVTDVNVVAVPVVTLTGATVCPGASFPTLDAGNAGSSFSWSTGENTQTITPSAAGTYTVTVTNSGSGINCSSSASATLTNSAPVVVTLGNNFAICQNDPDAVIDAGNAGSSFSWTLNGNTISGQTGQTLNINQAGTYAVTVTDGNGCTGTASVELTVNPLPVVAVGDDQEICPGEDLPTLDATGQNVATYDWTSNGYVVGNGPTYEVTAYGTYEITVTDNNGCRNSDDILIAEAPCEITIPNVITPDNGDGLNDVFFIKNLDTNPNSQLVIYNRWGNEVYSTSNYLNNWDGDDLPDGTYFYVLVLQTGKDYKGTLKLIREK